MQDHDKSRKRELRTALVGAIAAASVTLALMSALGGLFDSASQTPWLIANSNNAALLKPCDIAAGTAARHRCVAGVVAGVQRRERAGPGIELAGGDDIGPTAASAVVPR